MHYKVADHRSTPLRTLCTSTYNAIMDLVSFTKEPGLLDGVTAQEYAEYFYGAALVACQAYAVGTVGDINDMRESAGRARVSKINLYKYTSSSLGGPTEVEFINALANYFKHHEEWVTWPENETTRTLRSFGISEDTEFPLKAGCEKLIAYYPDLRGLCQILEN